MKRTTLLLILINSFASCFAQVSISQILKTGVWRAVLELQGHELPFNLEVYKNNSDQYEILLKNAEEKLLLDEVTVKGDSVDIALHIFDADIKAKIQGNELVGHFIKNYDKSFHAPFKAYYGQAYRYKRDKNQKSMPDFSGKYAVKFIHDKDTTVSVGIFKQFGDSLTGTFLTPTGDYRYLQGNIVNGKMQMSAFDGNHAYMVYGEKQNATTITGEFFSGKSSRETWIGEKNDNALMPDGDRITFLKKGFDKISFTFPDSDGKKVSLSDPAYKDKVVVLQILGSWCPNCLDETNFLVPWYEKNKSRDVKIIGLAYERKAEFAYASERVRKMVSRLKMTYPVLIAGTSDKANASKTLPMLNEVFAFPTTIFIGKDGKVKKIHTGFTGPGTGTYYEEFIEYYNQTINDLLAEKI
ncbi:MAG: TlpA disulfide reductase family protein [Chryseolinea sp.]